MSMYDSLDYNLTDCEYNDQHTEEIWSIAVCEASADILSAFKDEDWERLFRALPEKSVLWKKRLVDCVDDLDPNKLKALIMAADTPDEDLLCYAVGMLNELGYVYTEESRPVYERVQRALPAAKGPAKDVFIEFLRRKDHLR